MSGRRPSENSGGSSQEALQKEEDDDLESPVESSTTVHEGKEKFTDECQENSKDLSWKQLTICLVVEAIALGTLGMPSAFASLGMVCGVILTVALAFIAIYTSYVVGQVKLSHPEVKHYADAVRLIWGRPGYGLAAVMFCSFLILLAGSHTLTGTIALERIVDKPGICALIWGAVSAVVLFLVALPPTFCDFAPLGYIDFGSIIAAVLITIVATGVDAHNAPGGLAAVDWSLWPPEDISFYTVFLATTNIAFAYSFTVCQFTFMADMHSPKDYVKSIWSLGLIEMFIYTVTGALIYAFVGSNVSSPALLTAAPTVSRIAFGVALPVIFISGSINSTVVARYIFDRAFANSEIHKVRTLRGWATWIGLIASITVVGWLIAEAIPFFSDLLGIISSLFISGFSFYFPALFWFGLIKEGKWNDGWKNITLSIVNAIILAIGVVIFAAGTYASVQDIIEQYNNGNVGVAFSCSASAYS